MSEIGFFLHSYFSSDQSDEILDDKKLLELFDKVRTMMNLTAVFVAFIDMKTYALQSDFYSIDKDFNVIPKKYTLNEHICKKLYYYYPDDGVCDHADIIMPPEYKILHFGIFRDKNTLDGILGFLDAKNPNRVWTKNERAIIKYLGQKLRLPILYKKLEHESQERIETQKKDFESQVNVIASATSEYSSIFLIDTSNKKFQLFYKNDKIFTRLLSNYNDFETYDELMNNYKRVVHPDDLARFNVVINFDNVLTYLEDNDNFFINVRKVIDDKVYHQVLKYSKIFLDGKCYLVLALRNNTLEVEEAINIKNELEAQVRYADKYDELTGIYNKKEFIKQAIMKLRGTPKYGLYMISFDIDRLAIYNRYFGMPEGDNLLIFIGQTLINLSSKYDMIYGRFGADHFEILFDGTKEMLEKFISTLKYSVNLYNSRFSITLSVGVFEIKSDAVPLPAIIDSSMAASRSVKYRLDKPYGVYSEEMFKSKVLEQDIINNMESGLKHGEFVIYLQPKYDINKSEIIGAEALVRWIRDGKIISPGVFIPVFERNGFITKLDKFVWEQTIKYLKWRENNNLKLYPISVNVSRIFLLIPSFVDDIINLVRRYNVNPKYLELEITESIFMEDINLIKNTVDRLRSYGFKILMDDFGSGYSSLNVLKDVEFDVLKIDLKFFSSNEERSRKIIETVLDLAHSLEIPAIAEGVETKEYIDLLKTFGCNYAQGFYYSKPIPVDEFNKLLKDGSDKLGDYDE